MAYTFIYILLPETKGKTIEENIKAIIPDLKMSIKSKNYLFYFGILDLLKKESLYDDEYEKENFIKKN